jgi:MFS family permease
MIVSYTITGNFLQMVLVTVGAATGLSLIAPSLPALLTISVTSDNYGTAMGIYGASEDLGAIIGPTIYGIFWSTYGSTSIFYIYALMTISSVTLGLMLTERVQNEL